MPLSKYIVLETRYKFIFMYIYICIYAHTHTHIYIHLYLENLHCPAGSTILNNPTFTIQQ